MNNKETNQVIELIYEAATDPSKWTDLLTALGELVEYEVKQTNRIISEESLLSVIPSARTDNNDSSVSISEALKSITNIEPEESKNNDVNIEPVNNLLMRHFARAIKIAKRLVDMDEQHGVVLSLLDRMPIALVLVDSKARVIETNTLADEMLSTKDGLQVSSNILESGHESKQRLFEAIEQMSKHDPAITRGQSLSITNEQTQNNIMLFIAPLKQLSPQQQASVAIFISQRKSQPLTVPKEMTELYGLTNKEVEITGQLVRGSSIKEISEQTHVSQHTVRSQVKSVLKKTKTSRQAELVSLVYNGMSDFISSTPKNLSNKQNTLLPKSKLREQNYRVFQLADGRNLAYLEYGSPDGEPVFHCHTLFGSRLELAFDADKISQEKSVRLIVIDRPGYGASDPNPEATFTNWSEDLIQLADHLNIGKFSFTGYGMGGRYALACAHEIPDRLKRVASITNGMPAESSADYKKIMPFYRMNIRLAKYMPKAYGLISSVLVKGVLNDTDSFLKKLSEKMEQADRGIMALKHFRTGYATSLTEAFGQGGRASSREMVEYMGKWSFELPNIKIPIDIWHGACDQHIPLVLAERFAEHIKETRFFIKEGQGHYMFYTHWAEILDELLRKD